MVNDISPQSGIACLFKKGRLPVLDRERDQALHIAYGTDGKKEATLFLRVLADRTTRFLTVVGTCAPVADRSERPPCRR